MLYCKFYRYSDMEILKQLHVAFIRPNLEYLGMQRIFTSLSAYKYLNLFSVICVGSVTKRWNDASSNMLHTLNIPPLSERRKLF